MSYYATPELVGRTIVITGAGRGIGKELAIAALAAHMKVAILEIMKDDLEETVAELKTLGGDVTGYYCDLSNESEIIGVLTAVEKDFGKIEVLVNNAMFHDPSDFLHTTLEIWERTMRINLTAPFLVIRTVLPGMIKRGYGSIINIGSVNAKVMIGSDAYSASKGGLHSLTRTVAVRYGPDGVRCNTIVPGTIVSPGWQERIARKPQIFEDLKPWYPLGRVGKPADIAAAVLFLASDQSSWMTGTEFIVDGGLLAGYAPMHRTVEGSD
jgi:meso-butanediol dehydrogenase/(S,S)-butanediol dehydrogenase/diacetyl reductase